MHNYNWLAVVSGSMIPTLNISDFIIINHNIPFNSLSVGDIIVFKSPGSWFITHPACGLVGYAMYFQIITKWVTTSLALLKQLSQKNSKCGISKGSDVLYLPVMLPIIPDAFCLRDDAVLLLPLFVMLPPPVILLPPVLFAPPLNMLDAFCFSDDVKP
jgi:Signal peptidase, peptidase S26